MRAKFIFESPDNWTDKDGNFIEWDMVQYKPVTFAWYDDKLYATGEVLDRSNPNYRGLGNKDYRIPVHFEFMKMFNLKSKKDEDGDDKEQIRRSDFQWPGRLWINKKFISFWEHPSEEEMQILLKELQNKLDINILQDPEWIIEIYNDSEDYSGWVKVPVGEYTGSDKVSAAEKGKQHAMSPMLRRPNVSYGGKKPEVGSKHPKYQGAQKEKRFMYAESVKENLLNENPNATIDPKTWEKKKDQPSYTPPKIEFDEEGTIPFGFYGAGKTLITGTPKMTHMHLLNKAKKEGLLKTAGEFKERGRNSGRIFSNQKILSFWNFPKDYNELVDVIKELENKTNLNILNDPEWRVEIPAGEFKGAYEKDTGSWGSWHPRVGQLAFIPIDEYKGGYQRSASDLAQQHAFSPMDPRKKRTIPKLSSKIPQGLERLKMKYAMQSESFYPRLK